MGDGSLLSIMEDSEFYVKSNLSTFENHLALIQRTSS